MVFSIQIKKCKHMKISNIANILVLVLLLAGCTKETVKKVEVATPALLVSSKNLAVDASEGSSASFDIASNTDWSISNNASWLQISSDKGNGNATISITASENTASETRSATLTISGESVTTQTITVVQAIAGQVYLSVSASQLSILASAGSTATFDLSSNTSWSISNNQQWLSVSPSSGSDNAAVSLTATENTAATTRSATVTINGYGADSKTITVTQAASNISPDAKPNWTTTSTEFLYSMTMVAQINIDGLSQGIDTEDELAAFIGNECRGTATIETYGSKKCFMLLIKGNVSETNQISFKYYSKVNARIYTASQTRSFVVNQVVGTPDAPEVIDIK
jgi:hypothetical protein